MPSSARAALSTASAAKRLAPRRDARLCRLVFSTPQKASLARRLLLPSYVVGYGGCVSIRFRPGSLASCAVWGCQNNKSPSTVTESCRVFCNLLVRLDGASFTGLVTVTLAGAGGVFCQFFTGERMCEQIESGSEPMHACTQTEVGSVKMLLESSCNDTSRWMSGSGYQDLRASSSLGAYLGTRLGP